jgi:signal transduction histidine kinase
MESERLRNSLLSATSHDLRTPLTAIVGFASVLAEADETPPETPPIDADSAEHEAQAAASERPASGQAQLAPPARKEPLPPYAAKKTNGKMETR